MHFPNDFKKRVKAILPSKWHKYVDEESFAVTKGQLGIVGNFSLDAKTIVKAFENGREKEDVFKPAQNAITAWALSRELWNLKKQFGAFD